MNLFARGGLIFAAALLSFAPALSGGFLWDDYTYIVHSYLMQVPDGLRRIWLTHESADFWPLTYSLLWGEWQLWKDQAFGYHLVALLLHGIGAVLVYANLLRLRHPLIPASAAFIAALLFAVHPVNAETAAWIFQTKTSLCFVFCGLSAYLLLVACGTRFRPAFHVLSMLCFVAAMLSKSAAVALPPVLGLLLLAQRRPANLRHGFRIILPALPFLAVGGAIAGYSLAWYDFQVLTDADAIRHETWPAKIAATAMAFWFYVGKTVLPVALSFIYPRWQLQTLGVLHWLPMAALLSGAAVLAWWSYRSRSWLIAGAVAAYLCLLAPVLGLVDIYFMRYSLVADHWQYLAMPAGILAVVLAARMILRNAMASRVAAIAATLLLMGLSVQRSLIFRDELAVWQDTYARNPGSALVADGVGAVLVRRGQEAAARPYFEKAIANNPFYPEAKYNLGLLLHKEGRLDEARTLYESAVAIRPAFVEAWNNLGILLYRRGELDAALQHLREGSRQQPNFRDVRYNLGRLLLMENDDVEGALPHLLAALEVAPASPDTLYHLGVLYKRANNLAQAQQFFKAIPQDSPWYAGALLELGGGGGPVR